MSKLSLHKAAIETKKMNTIDQMFDRYFLFLSTDFFVDYWMLFAGDSFTSSAKSVIQSAGRETVAKFMGIEKVYWNIDFSPERHKRSIAFFTERLKSLPAHDRIHHDMMQSNLCEDEQEQINITFALSFLYRISKDHHFSLESGLELEDSEIVTACIPSRQDLDLDTYQIELDWLNSESKLDEKIKNYTPDLPEYVWLTFNNAYQKFVKFPTFINNVSHLLETQPRHTFLTRLAEALKNQFPEESDLSVPKLIRITK